MKTGKSLFKPLAMLVALLAGLASQPVAAKPPPLPKTVRTLQEEEARRARKMRYRVTEQFVIYRGAAFFPGATMAPNGDIIVVFGTTSDNYPGGKVLMMRSSDQGKSWSGPVALVTSTHEGGAAGSMGSLATMPDGTLFFLFGDNVLKRKANVSPQEIDPGRIFDFGSVTGALYSITSSDNGATWSKRQEFLTDIPLALGGPYGPPFRLKDGSLFLSFHFLLKTGENFRSGFLISRDAGKTWHGPQTAAYTSLEELGITRPVGASGGGWNETAFIQLGNGDIVGMVRQDGDLGPRRLQFHVRSTDGGATWTKPQATDAYGKMPDLMALPSGEILMALGSINLDDGSLVFPKAREIKQKLGGTASFAGLLISADGGLTWKEDARFESPLPEGVPFDDPAMLALPGGRIFAVFMAADESFTDPKGVGWDGGYFLVGNILELVP